MFIEESVRTVGDEANSEEEEGGHGCRVLMVSSKDPDISGLAASLITLRSVEITSAVAPGYNKIAASSRAQRWRPGAGSA